MYISEVDLYKNLLIQLINNLNTHGAIEVYFIINHALFVIMIYFASFPNAEINTYEFKEGGLNNFKDNTDLGLMNVYRCLLLRHLILVKY